jgi:pimeloyl-ACP methyl ester carboxylesterase
MQCPVLMLTADVELGGIVTPEMAREAQALCPTLRVEHIAGAGHAIRREQPEAFMAAVRRFLAETFRK